MAELPRGFRILSAIANAKKIAEGRGIDIRQFLRDRYGGDHWRKMKGHARVEKDDGWIVTQKFTGMMRTASAKSSGRSSESSIAKRRYPYFAICIDNRGDDISLHIGKVYRVIKPEPNDGPRDLRVIDEEGEDYLYSMKQFVPIELPPKAKHIFAVHA